MSSFLRLEVPFEFPYTDRMKNKNTIKQLVTLMEEAQESPHFIIGWMMSMIDQSATDKTYQMQESIDNGMKYFQDQAFKRSRIEMNQIQKVANGSSIEELYA
jgi:hypothetical protein